MICFASPETLYAGYIEGEREYMDFDSREQLDGYLAVEPYVQEHIWDRIEVEQVNVVIR